MIRELNICGLFGMYNYNIQFNNEPNVMILTGPNGFGKTTTLQIINHFCNRRFWYFYYIPFQSIVISFDNDICYSLQQDNQRDENNNIVVNSVLITNSDNGTAVEEGIIDKDYIEQLYRSFIYKRTDMFPFSRQDELLDILYQPFNDDYINSSFPLSSTHLSTQRCLMMEEQRLIESSLYRRTILPAKTVDDIQNKIVDFFAEAQKAYNQTSFKIDGTFVKRLSDYSESHSINNIKKERVFRQVKEKIAQYKKYGLVNELEVVEDLGIHYAAVLKLYLNDLYSKLMSIDSFYKKLSTFDRLVSGKRLSYKYLCFENGKMLVNNVNGTQVPINKLSSGEQNLIVLCYRLVFEIESNGVILIDEPENSLHMSWLDNLLSDYIEIARNNGCQIIISTHSPAFIHGRWDLTYDLCENGNVQ